MCTERDHDDNQALANPPTQNAYPFGAFESLGFTHRLVSHFKPITTGVCGDALELCLSPNS
jgi:hypothetical protein